MLHGKKHRQKINEWIRRYLPAELLGTLLAVLAAWNVYSHSHSYVAAAAAGWVGEGIGFYGYFITSELLRNGKRYKIYPLFKRITAAAARASTNLFIEFVPAEVIDNLFIRPFLMYAVPQFIHPYPLGFLAGKLLADAAFYLFAIVGYETRKRLIGN